MAQVRSNRRSSGLRGNVGVLPLPKVAVSQDVTKSGMSWLLFAVAVIAAYLLIRVVLVNRLSSVTVQSAVPAGTVIALDGQSNSKVAETALQVSQPSVQAERLQGSSADNYFQPTGGTDLQATGSGDSLQMTQSSYSQQGSVGTSRR